MSQRLPVTPAPAPLEEYARLFDELFSTRSQREAFRRYLEGLLLPMERNKTLTALANTEPGTGSIHPKAQKLQWFLSESNWHPDDIGRRRLDLLFQDQPTAPTSEGVLVIDETGDRKWGTKTAHVGRQYLGSIGKVDQGVVSVHSLWADEALYWPVAAGPYTPAHWFDRGKRDPAFRTKLQIALELVEEALVLELPFRAVVADSLYGENLDFRDGLSRLEVGYVLGLRPSNAWWHPIGTIGSVWEVVRAARWSEQDPGRWVKIMRRFRDGHEERWWVLEGECGPYGQNKSERLIIVTTDPETLPDLTTWYVVTNLPAPGSAPAQKSRLPAADLAEIVRLYGLRMWVEQGYKQVKGTLGWAQYQVRSDVAMRRHWQLVLCAFSFCWWTLTHHRGMETELAEMLLEQPEQPELVEAETVAAAGEKNRAAPGELAPCVASGTGLAGAVYPIMALLAGMVGAAPTGAAAALA